MNILIIYNCALIIRGIYMINFINFKKLFLFGIIIIVVVVVVVGESN